MDTGTTILLAILGSTGLSTVIVKILDRIFQVRDIKKGKNNALNDFKSALLQDLQDIKDKQLIAERDSCRIQLLVMINHYPSDHNEIMKLAEHYFDVLDGDWYMTSIFKRWLRSNDIEQPEWFNSED